MNIPKSNHKYFTLLKKMSPALGGLFLVAQTGCNGIGNCVGIDQDKHYSVSTVSGNPNISVSEAKIAISKTATETEIKPARIVKRRVETETN